MSNPKLSKIKAREQAGKDGELIYYTRAERCYLLKLVERLGKVLENNKAQAHYFLCKGINDYPHDQDKGDCHAGHCKEARALLKELEL
jgi:hypothetical protein